MHHGHHPGTHHGHHLQGHHGLHAHHGHHGHHGHDGHDGWGHGGFDNGFSWNHWGVAGAGSLVNPYVSGGVVGGGVVPAGGVAAAGVGPAGVGAAGIGPAYDGTFSPTDTAGILAALADANKKNQEALILYEQARALRIKSRVDAENYPRPTFTEEKAEIDRSILARARTTSDESAICSGQALNVLLDDLRKAKGVGTLSSVALGDDTLTHINVTVKKLGNLGLLRNDVAFTWPDALTDETIVSKQERETIELKARSAVQQATKGNLPKSVLTGLRTFSDSTRGKLLKKINSIPGGDYLEAKRFLNNFDAACLAMEKGEAVPYFRFQNWIDTGKTIQDIAGYMIREGLSFAPAVCGDEQAYRALHGALAAYDMEVHQLAAAVASARNRE
jgi:hypothetical protein